MMKESSLFKKLVKVMKQVDKIEKSGYNKYQKYHYSTENDIIDAIKPALIDNNIFMVTSVEDVQTDLVNTLGDKNNYLTTVKMKHTFIDADTGEQFEAYSAGAGADTLDKGIFKAQTGAFKYLFSKNFLIQSELMDPENDGVTPIKKSDKTTPGKSFSNKSLPGKNTTLLNKTVKANY